MSRHRHAWEWDRDDYTTARYRCACGKERGVWKNRVAAFEAENNVTKRRPRG